MYTKLGWFLPRSDHVQRKFLYLLKCKDGKTWKKSEGLDFQQQVLTYFLNFLCNKRIILVILSAEHFLSTWLFTEVIYGKVYFVKIGPIFVDSALFRFKKYQNSLLGKKST